jgi:hypothetical protein
MTAPTSDSGFQFGVPLDASAPLFFGCLAAGIGLVYLFCQQKFGERLVTENKDYVYQLMPRQLATREEYSKGFMIYFGTMASLVALLSLIGPKNLASLGLPLPPDLSNAVIPLCVAFLLVGVMPVVPMLQDVERRLRQYAHERAYIPTAARATAQRLAAADFDFSSYDGDTLKTPDMRGVDCSDFARSRRTLEHDWARLSCLVYELKSRQLSGVTDALDADLLNFYENDVQNIAAKRKSMEDEVARYRAERAKDPSYANDELRLAIRSNLDKLYILLACAVRVHKEPHEDIDLALRPFGFKLSKIEAQDGNMDLKVIGMTVMAACVLGLGLAAVGFASLKVWRVSDDFPLLLYGSAILVADRIRSRYLRKGIWFRKVGGRRQGSGANYLQVAALSGLIGYIALNLWDLAFFSQFDLSGLKIEAPFALLPAVTGVFYVYHLDNAELHTRPRRWIEIGSQALATGLCGLIATAAWVGVLGGNAGDTVDLLAFKAAIGLTVGASLGFYIPRAAAATKSDPLSEARDERVRNLETAARERHRTPAAASAWLEKPLPALGNRSPKAAAAADVEGFEHAISLLPPALSIAA